MARLVLIMSLMVLIGTLLGCNGVDTGRAQILPAQAPASPGATVSVAGADEVDLAEQVAASRQAYRQAIETLVHHYTKTGNNMKLTWAQKELDGLNSMPRYDYIVEATVAGANLKAARGVSEADQLYNEAVRLEKQAGQFLVIKDNNLLRMALDKYNQLISRYPTSDKIDDAAFRAAGIYEHFKDYTIAALYYQRTYQWDPDTIYPARFKAAFILDRHLHRRAEALRIYQEALARVTSAGQHPQWQQYAENRVKVLTGEVEPEALRQKPMESYK